MALSDLFAGQPVDVDEMVRHLQQTAQSLDLPFGARKNTYNSRLAQELGLWAESEGRGHRFHDLAFRAYFRDGLNIAEIPVLRDLATAAGLDAAAAETVLADRTFRDAVDADWALAAQLDIRAVPTFVMGGSRLVGAQPYEKLEKMMSETGIAPKVPIRPA